MSNAASNTAPSQLAGLLGCSTHVRSMQQMQVGDGVDRETSISERMTLWATRWIKDAAVSLYEQLQDVCHDLRATSYRALTCYGALVNTWSSHSNLIESAKTLDTQGKATMGRQKIPGPSLQNS